MAITVCGNCIGFGGTYTMCSTTPGFSFDGEIRALEGFCDTRVFQGETFGYLSGCLVQKFPLVSDASATCVGGNISDRYLTTGASSKTHGYSLGGYSGSTYCNRIEKFPFASDTNASFGGSLTNPVGLAAGQSDVRGGKGYATGGFCNPPLVDTNVMNKFPFFDEAPSVDIGNLTVDRYGGAGLSSIVNGYTAGGSVLPNNSGCNIIDKFPFAADAPATDVGEMVNCKYRAAGISSTVSGYQAGGDPFGFTIEKFPFSSDTPSSDIGELIPGGFGWCGQAGSQI